MPKTSKEQTKEPSAAELLRETIQNGAWYWFIAETPDENMVSALHRLQYRELVRKLETFRIPLPTPGEMIAYAKDKWPAHRLHA